MEKKHIHNVCVGHALHLILVALLIEGARHIGKSTIVEKFGKEQYKSYILIDFRVASKAIKDNFNDNAQRIHY